MSTAIDALDYDHYHTTELPQLLTDGRGALAAHWADAMGSLALRLEDGRAYTYVPSADGITIVPGHESADIVFELTEETWKYLTLDLESLPGLLYTGNGSIVEGDALGLMNWEPALRAMYTGRPPFDPDAADLRDRNGKPLDARQSFALDDDPADMAHFLKTAGYIHIRDVFTPEEVERFRGYAQQLADEAVPGDKLSWWAKNADGEQVLCRVIRGATIPELRGLHKDPRIEQLAALSDQGLIPRSPDSVEGVTVIYKNPNITSGLSDLPWHRDCGMGGHATNCPTMIASVYIYDATEESGQLRVLPGSWTGTFPVFDHSHPGAPSGVPLTTRAGDVSLHYSDTMHAAPPPTSNEGPFRASITFAYFPPTAANHRGEKNYNQSMLSRDDGQVDHLLDIT